MIGMLTSMMYNSVVLYLGSLCRIAIVNFNSPSVIDFKIGSIFWFNFNQFNGLTADFPSIYGYKHFQFNISSETSNCHLIIEGTVHTKNKEHNRT